jgi:ribosome-associated translation inhibitor RaiA
MDRPLELMFHDMDPSSEIEARVRIRVKKLEEIYQHIIGCRVAIDLEITRHGSGGTPDVHVNIQVPGQEVIVSRHHIRGESASTTVNHAFDAAEFQLKEYKARKKGRAKHHATASDVVKR